MLSFNNKNNHLYLDLCLLSHTHIQITYRIYIETRMSSINDENDVELVKIRNERLNESLQRKYKYLLIDINKQTGIALVTINRPEVFNALNLDAHLEMANVFKDLDLNPFVKVIVITGAGKAFCRYHAFDCSLSLWCFYIN